MNFRRIHRCPIVQHQGHGVHHRFPPPRTEIYKCCQCNDFFVLFQIALGVFFFLRVFPCLTKVRPLTASPQDIPNENEIVFRQIPRFEITSVTISQVSSARTQTRSAIVTTTVAETPPATLHPRAVMIASEIFLFAAGCLQLRKHYAQVQQNVFPPYRVVEGIVRVAFYALACCLSCFRGSHPDTYTPRIFEPRFGSNVTRT